MLAMVLTDAAAPTAPPSPPASLIATVAAMEPALAVIPEVSLAATCTAAPGPLETRLPSTIVAVVVF